MYILPCCVSNKMRINKVLYVDREYLSSKRCSDCINKCISQRFLQEKQSTHTHIITYVCGSYSAFASALIVKLYTLPLRRVLTLTEFP